MNDDHSNPMYGAIPSHGGLPELELDALTELVNLGVSRAANALRELVGEEVLLTVPAVVILTREEAATRRSARPP
jgi:chemotaxis protein CheY-P-specific phosphatase CheC